MDVDEEDELLFEEDEDDVLFEEDAFDDVELSLT